MNLFGSERALQVLEQMPIVPLGLLIDVVSHLWHAMTVEMQRRGGQFIPVLDDLSRDDISR